MKIKSIELITEEARKVDGVTFLNSTSDQFPYVESTLNSLDNNFKWWKTNWPDIEQLISKYLNLAKKEHSKTAKINVSSRLTFFHGTDEKVKDVIWSGPAIVYTFAGGNYEIVKSIKNSFGGIYKGHKIFIDDNQLIILFG